MRDDEKLAEQLLEVSTTLVQRARRIASGSGPRDVTLAQMQLLRVVRRQPGITAAEAAARLRVARNTLSTLVGQLAAAGLLERVRDNEDGRVVRLYLLPAADARMAAWRARRLRAATAAVETLSDAEHSAVTSAIAALEAVVAALSDAASSHPARSEP